MREMLSHIPGRIVLIIFALCTIVFIVILPLITEPSQVIGGWMTVPVFGGILFMAIWLITLIVYINKFWPYR